MKAFAKFPTTSGGYQYLDVFRIESIGQSTEPTLAVIFVKGTDQRYYSVEVVPAELERAGEPDAASWCLSLVSKVSRQGGFPLLQARPDEADDEDFGAPTQPYGYGVEPEFRKD